MAKGSSGLAAPVWNARRSPVNTGAPWPVPKEAEARVLGIQRKLHKWASDDPNRRFNDLHNLVCDPATLMMAWLRVRSNRGSRSAGVDGQTARHVEQQVGVEKFLDGLREELRSGSFRPLPVKERLIPKRGGKTPATWGACPSRPRDPGCPQDGARADLRGRLQTLLLRVPARTPSARRDRRDTYARDQLLRVGSRSRHQGVFRRNLACRRSGPAASPSRGQARHGAHQGVPQSRDPDRAGRPRRDAFGHPAGRDSLAADRQRRAVGTGRALRPRVADNDGDTARTGEDQTPRRRYLPPDSLRR